MLPIAFLQIRVYTCTGARVSEKVCAEVSVSFLPASPAAEPDWLLLLPPPPPFLPPPLIALPLLPDTAAAAVAATAAARVPMFLLRSPCTTRVTTSAEHSVATWLQDHERNHRPLPHAQGLVERHLCIILDRHDSTEVS